MSRNRSIRSRLTSASQTAIGDLFVTASVVLFLMGAAAVIMLICQALFHLAEHAVAK